MIGLKKFAPFSIQSDVKSNQWWFPRIYPLSLIGPMDFCVFCDWLMLYGCFEKGYPTKPCATMPKGILGNGVHGHKCICAFSFLVGKHREPQLINAKLFLPKIPIGIVPHAFTLL